MTFYLERPRISPALRDGAVDPIGTVEVAPPTNTTYTITATGPGGSASKSAMVTVIHPAPTVTLSAEPSTIKPGESIILQWASTDAVSVTSIAGSIEFG